LYNIVDDDILAITREVVFQVVLPNSHMLPTDPLLTTKLYLPSARAELINRPRLVSILDGAIRQHHKLILVSAPAGFGKTTLVADWLRRSGRKAAWLSLDKDDNNPARFWRYVIAALQTVDAALGQTALAALAAPQLPPLESLLASLINDLSGLTWPIILVLDDYHFIETEAIHNSLTFFLDHLPVQLCLVITTRVNPPLALSRLRGRAQLTEARTADLRFSTEEAGAFLNIANNLNLPEEDIASLENRTEGWIVGLQLAALSLRLQADRRAFVAAFAGDDHYVADYLLEEVLQHQSPEMQTFLIQTSILDRLCGPLCETVTGREDCQGILDRLEQANLFVVPLDNRRYWYRYHHLFADLLRRRLHQAMTHPEWMALYRRACAWYEQEGLVVEAISQALTVSDFEYAADLLDKYVLSVFYRSETMLVHQWLKSLPEDVIRARPLLCAVYANILAHMVGFRGQPLQQAESWLQFAEQALANVTSPTRPSTIRPDSDIARRFIDLSHAYFALWRNEAPQKVISLAQHALSGLPDADDITIDPNYLRFHSGLNCNLGISYLNLGDETAANLAFDRARKIGEKCGDLLNASAAVANQSDILRRHGRLHEAFALCREALESFRGPGKRPDFSIPFVGIIHVTLGQVYLEWNSLDEAESTLMQGLELSKLTSGANINLMAYISLARLKQARGDYDSALTLLDQVEQKRTEINTLVDALRVRLRMFQGNLAVAAKWANGRHFLDVIDNDALTLVRVSIALHRSGFLDSHNSLPTLDSTIKYLENKVKALENTTWVELTIELLMFHALACQARNDITTAMSSLQKVLTIAEPGGYIRLFLDEGAPMRLLLAKLKNSGGTPQAYINMLLSAFAGEVMVLPTIYGSESLSEPLSAREMEVLRLLAAGCSNADIASKLVISLNTTKKHISHIFEKLAVTNRADAVARARELGLVV